MDLKNKIKNTIINLSARIKNTDDSKCIFYHDIHSDHRFTDMSTSVELFEKHINIIRELGFEIVHEITKEKNQISISFDDGIKGVYENIGIINKLEVPVTIFVVSSFLDRDNFLTTHNLKELAKNKFIKIQSHTLSHAELPTLDSAHFNGFGGDNYAMKAKGDTICIAHFGGWDDTFIMKSTDSNYSSTRTVVYLYILNSVYI